MCVCRERARRGMRCGIWVSRVLAVESESEDMCVHLSRECYMCCGVSYSHPCTVVPGASMYTCAVGVVVGLSDVECGCNG